MCLRCLGILKYLCGQVDRLRSQAGCPPGTSQTSTYNGLVEPITALRETAERGEGREGGKGGGGGKSLYCPMGSMTCFSYMLLASNISCLTVECFGKGRMGGAY